MNVQMGNALADPVVDRHKGTIGFHSHFDRLRQELRILEKRFQQLFRQVRQSFVILPGNQQTMAGENGAVVQKGDGNFVFKHQTRQDITADNLTKLAGRVCSHEKSQKRWFQVSSFKFQVSGFHSDLPLPNKENRVLQPAI